ncbi:MAG: YibE/F family protein [Mycobacterium sp.]|nr:YibE/F family protein [Mycobacterium sp.]
MPAAVAPPTPPRRTGGARRARGQGAPQAHGHTHGHPRTPGGPADRAGSAAHRRLLLLLLPFALATVAGLVLLWPSGAAHALPAQLQGSNGTPVGYVNARVTALADCPAAGAGGCQQVTARLSGGSTVSLQQTLGPGQLTLRLGDPVRLAETADPGTGALQYYVDDYTRGPPLLLLGALFALVIVGIARWRGLAALVGLGVAMAALVVFVLPALLDGKSPLAVAVVGSAAILFVVLYLAHGFSARTSSALLGTLAALAATAALGTAALPLARITGLSSEETGALQTYVGQVPLRGLLLAGLVIGAIGVLNDITVTQASVVWELAEADPAAGPGTLYRRGMRVGRDHIASTVYTLVLAYAGAALPTLLLFTVARRSIGQVLTGDLVGTEVVRSIVGGIGLSLAVPASTIVAALAVRATGRRQ